MKNLMINIILIVFAFSSCKVENKKIAYNSGEWNFNACIQPIDAVLYSDYIILLENETDLYYRSNIRFEKAENIYVNTSFTAVNYFTNEIDTVFQDLINRKGISELYVKEDTLYAFDVFKKVWLQWNNKWIEKSPFDNKFYLEFEKSRLNKRCRLIFEDEKYFVYSCDMGEYGAAVLFLNKENGKVSGHPMILPTSVFKDKNAYVVSGNTEFYMKMSQLIKIETPDQLLAILENRILYANDRTKYKYQHKEHIIKYMFNEIMLKLPDSLQLKHQSIQKKIKELKKIKYYDLSIWMSYKRQIDTLFKFDNNLNYLLDNGNWYNDNETLCLSTYRHKNKLLHVLGDSVVYVVESENGELIKQEDTIFTANLSPRDMISNWQVNDKRLLVFNSNSRVDTCSVVNCFVIDNDYVKSYFFK